jgi:hypothetical protein
MQDSQSVGTRKGLETVQSELAETSDVLPLSRDPRETRRDSTSRINEASDSPQYPPERQDSSNTIEKQLSGETLALQRAEDFARQGDNDPGWKMDCGLASTGQMLREAGAERNGHPVTERDAVEVAESKMLASVEMSWDSEGVVTFANSGGTNPESRAQLCSEFGVEAPQSYAHSIDQLANMVENDRGVIAAVNAGALWDDAKYDAGEGLTNHAIWVTAVERDESRELTAFFVNDTGKSDGGANRIPLGTMREAWERSGGKVNCTTKSLTELRKGNAE